MTRTVNKLITAPLIRLIGHFQRWLDLQNRRMLRTLAAMATSPRGRPIQGPTPELTPARGAKKGRITYVRAHRTPEITIDVLNTRVSTSFAKGASELLIWLVAFDD